MINIYKPAKCKLTEYRLFLKILPGYLNQGESIVLEKLMDFRQQLEQAKKDLYDSQFSISSSNGELSTFTEGNFAELIGTLCSDMEDLPFFENRESDIVSFRNTLIQYFTNIYNFKRLKKTFPQPDKAIDEVERIIRLLAGTEEITQNLYALASIKEKIDINMIIFASCFMVQFVLFHFSGYGKNQTILYLIAPLLINQFLQIYNFWSNTADKRLIENRIYAHLKSLRTLSPVEIPLQPLQQVRKAEEQEP